MDPDPAIKPSDDPIAADSPTGVGDEFDPANQLLADALRKSFRVLKLLMVVLVVLYFLSGWFSVKPNERGVVLRFGRIVGAGSGRAPDQRTQAVLDSGWHWSWPFPIDKWETITVSERELPLRFMFQLSKREKSTGVIERRYNTLAPERDDYLVTGDVNILHASLVIKYHVSNVIDYITNIHPMPDPKATVRSKPFRFYPEYTILRHLARDAVIETAAQQHALKIRGNQQNRFLLAVARTLNRKLKILSNRGTPLGLSVDPLNGVIAPKGKVGTLEAIMPPRQTQEVFDQVFASQAKRASAISKAQSQARALLVETAGESHEQFAESIEREYALLQTVSKMEDESDGKSDSIALQTQRKALRRRYQKTDEIMARMGGDVRTIVQNAEIKRNQIVKEVIGDYNRFMAILPKYQRDPDIFISRLLYDAYARILSYKEVTKLYVPPQANQYRLHIPRSGNRILKEQKDNTNETALSVFENQTSKEKK